MSSYVSLILDIVVLCALAATIVYARKLSRQFGDMRADRKAFEKLIDAINSASARANIATQSLRDAAQHGSDTLQEKINAARALSDELEIVVEAGDHLAQRLETLARRSPTPAREAAPSTTETVTEPRREPVTGQPRTRAEKELLEALRAKQLSG